MSPRTLGLKSGIGLVIANMVGAGVFLSTGFMAQSLSPGLILLAWLIGGFLAPRASYLVGIILGGLTGILWTVVLFANAAVGADLVTSTGDFASTIGTVLLASLILGMFAAGFAGWYRDFLRGMQTRSRDRQVQREADLKAKRAIERQEARRAAKSRPVS